MNASEEIYNVVEASGEVTFAGNTDQDILDWGDTVSATGVANRIITQWDIINEATPPNPDIGEQILEALEDYRDGTQTDTPDGRRRKLVGRVLEGLNINTRDGERGLNIGDKNFRDLVRDLNTDGHLTNVQKNKLLDLAPKYTNWFANGINFKVKLGHITGARSYGGG